MEITFKTYKVEVGTLDFLLRGDFQPRGDLLIYLNDQSNEYFRFDNAELLPMSSEYQVPGIKQPMMILNRRFMTSVSILNQEDADQLQILRTHRPVVTYTKWGAIQGELHVNDDARDDDLLSVKYFFALSDAKVFPIRSLNTAPTRKIPLVLINRKVIYAYHVHKPKEA